MNLWLPTHLLWFHSNQCPLCWTNNHVSLYWDKKRDSNKILHGLCPLRHNTRTSCLKYQTDIDDDFQSQIARYFKESLNFECLNQLVNRSKKEGAVLLLSLIWQYCTGYGVCCGLNNVTCHPLQPTWGLRSNASPDAPTKFTTKKYSSLKQMSGLEVTFIRKLVWGPGALKLKVSIKDLVTRIPHMCEILLKSFV